MTDEPDDRGRTLRRLRPLVLPTLVVCWVVYATSSSLTESGGGIDYLGVTLGVGLMIAGAIQFLRPRTSAEDGRDSAEYDRESPSSTTEDDA